MMWLRLIVNGYAIVCNFPSFATEGIDPMGRSRVELVPYIPLIGSGMLTLLTRLLACSGVISMSPW